jgi:hypothetical protein
MNHFAFIWKKMIHLYTLEKADDSCMPSSKQWLPTTAREGNTYGIFFHFLPHFSIVWTLKHECPLFNNRGKILLLLGKKGKNHLYTIPQSSRCYQCFLFKLNRVVLKTGRRGSRCHCYILTTCCTLGDVA